jgi:hypothetical protein
VDLGPIGTGQLPGEAVTVSYSTLKLKKPEVDSSPTTEEAIEQVNRMNWEQNVVTSSPEPYYVNYRDATGALQTRTYVSSSRTATKTAYRVIRVRNDDGEVQRKEVVSSRVVTETVGAIAKLSNCAAKYAEAGFSFNNATITTKTVTVYSYDEYGNEESSSSSKSEPEAALLGAANFDWVYGGKAWPASYSLILAERIITNSSQSGNYTQKITSTYLRFAFTQSGQQATAVARELGAESTEVAQIIVDAVFGSGLVHNNTTTETNLSGASQVQSRPSPAERTNAELSKDGDPNNGWRTDSKAQLELALGSATAQRRIEFSMPYAPDDIFSGPSGGPFTATASDAPAKANRYGRVQNRLLLGNRSGVNLQLAPERLPVAPFSPLYLQADGLTALYRANGNQWAFDSNGIVCSTDALFWAAVGGTGTFWFPVAPGITTLPSTPPITDGQMNATNVVLPYNETAIYEGRLRLGNVATKFEYALELLTEIPALSLVTNAIVALVKIVKPPTASTALTALAPQVSISARVDVPTAATSLTGVTPEINTGKAVQVPTASLALTGLTPELVGRPGLKVFVPSLDLGVAAFAPSISTSATVFVPSVSLTVTAFKPAAIGKLDVEAFDLFLLIEDDLLSLRNP